MADFYQDWKCRESDSTLGQAVKEKQERLLLAALGEEGQAGRPAHVAAPSEDYPEIYAATHAVRGFKEARVLGERPLEIVTTRQWYIRNGGRDEQLREKLLARGDELTWHPDFMQHRYANWVGGLNGDWLVSRQRYFGVPIPLWYRLDAQGEIIYENPLVPTSDQLPKWIYVLCLL